MLCEKVVIALMMCMIILIVYSYRQGMQLGVKIGVKKGLLMDEYEGPEDEPIIYN
jgi:hypothetical protein